MHIVLADQVAKCDLGILDMLVDSFVDNELEFCRCGQSIAGLRGPGRAKIDLLSGQGGQGELVHTQGGGSIHAGMFAEKTRLAIFKHDHCRNGWNG